MLKFSICSGAWILMILLFVASVVRAKNYNILNTVDSLCHYHHNHCYHRYCAQLETANYTSVTSSHILQDFTNNTLNDTYLHNISFTGLFESNNNSKVTVKYSDNSQRSRENKLKSVSPYSKNASIPNFFLSTINDYVRDPNNLDIRLILLSNDILSKLPRKRDNLLWKRRTLCSVLDDGTYSAETAFQRDVSSEINERENTGQRKTLSDYDGSIFMNAMEDADSLTTHVRVKRSGSDSNPHSSIAYQQSYLKDLANSFPRNSYESLNENSYDDDLSFDTKREINSEEYFANDEQSIEPGNEKVEFENDRSRISDTDPLAISLSSSSDETSPHDNKELAEKDLESNQFDNQQTMSEEPSKKFVSFTDRRYQDIDSDINLSEDPTLSVELVRKKRDDFEKAQSKGNLEDKDLSSSQDGLSDPVPAKNDHKNELEPDKTVDSCKTEKELIDVEKVKRDLSRHGKLSSLAIANFKADLLRFKRRAKNDRREKSSKAKKKRKHEEKKHDTSSRSRKTVRTKNAIQSTVARERKSDETRGEGKSKVGFARLVSKAANNKNNFRRRSVKVKKSIESTNSENDRSSTRVRSKKVGESIHDNSAPLLAAQTGSDVGGVTVDEKGNAPTLNENHPSLLENERSITEQGRKLRAKREKRMKPRHGFLNEDDELRYYENIHEHEPETAGCDNQDERSQSSGGNEAEGRRAARSIEEVKELAKKLVTKVNELENYLNVDEGKQNDGGEKRIETRAIDDLCSNVTTACAVLKETPKIVQRCAPLKSTNHEHTSTAKIVVERKADTGGNVNKVKRARGKNNVSMQKKRSTGERVVKTPSSTSRTVRGENAKEGLKWGRWTDWSSCSVTCGKGRQIRWRYCLHDCGSAETEMEEKACQLPACPPGKFLGIF
ncbi:uncharacterized protein LOC143188345 [Calliopsis andreniformis]|uniref:uncharacterized protein LOC143188345 n=1 Tax=Calliopsis andreniformis TaxID=337506 RepID=UPI003FCE7417